MFIWFSVAAAFGRAFRHFILYLNEAGISAITSICMIVVVNITSVGSLRSTDRQYMWWQIHMIILVSGKQL